MAFRRKLYLSLKRPDAWLAYYNTERTFAYMERVKYCMNSNLGLAQTPRIPWFCPSQVLGAPLAMSRAEMESLAGFLRHHPDYRRCLYRPSEFRHGAGWPPARSAGFPASASSVSRNGIRPPIFASSASPTCSTASPPATWIRWSIATPPTARSAPTTPTPQTPSQQTPGPRSHRLCPALPGGLRRCAGHHWLHRGQPAPHRPLRLLVGQGTPFGVLPGFEGRSADFRQCRAGHRRRRPPFGQGKDRRHSRFARYRLSWCRPVGCHPMGGIPWIRPRSIRRGR